jgi:hypothetical protein
MIREKPAPHLDSGVDAGFPKRSCLNNKLKRDSDSISSYRALDARGHPNRPFGSIQGRSRHGRSRKHPMQRDQTRMIAKDGDAAHDTSAATFSGPAGSVNDPSCPARVPRINRIGQRLAPAFPKCAASRRPCRESQPRLAAESRTAPCGHVFRSRTASGST